MMGQEDRLDWVEDWMRNKGIIIPTTVLKILYEY